MSNNSGNRNNGGGNGAKKWNGGYGKKPWFKKNGNNNWKGNGNKNNGKWNGGGQPRNNRGGGDDDDDFNRPNKSRAPFANKNMNQNESNDDFDDESSAAFIFEASAQNETACVIEEDPDCPYSMWNLYFPRERFKEQSDTHQLIEKLISFIESLKNEFDINEINEKGFFNIDYKILCTNQTLLDKIPHFSEKFIQNPDFYLNGIGLAMHQVIHKRYKYLIELYKTEFGSDSSKLSHDYTKELSSFKSPEEDVAPLKVRVLNFNPRVKIRQLKINMYQQFASVTGTVVRMSSPSVLLTRMAFECAKCQITFQIVLSEGIYREPARCASKTCNSKHFTPLLRHLMTKTIIWQKIRIQESSADVENSRVPRTIDCELIDDLTGICSPGDMVTVSGIVRALTVENASSVGRSNNKDKVSCICYIDVNSVQGEGVVSVAATNSLSFQKDTEFTEKELECFKEIQSEQDPLKLIVHSLCPSIFGHELVKAGLILGLFGGSQTLGNNQDISIRSDTHILVVGDPGLGKSQLLKACANITPRGVYVCGSSSTSSGLTITLAKESGDDFAIEAGALLCAHNGVCCIDEFDKMGSQQQSLLEVMEQQSISIAKGGVVCNLPCKTTVIAAANPCGGHYDKSKSVSENLRISGPLLSRFDLLFILLDKADEELDYKLSSHIIHLYSNKSSDSSSNLYSSSRSGQYSTKSEESEESRNMLSSRLKMDPNELQNFDPIPPPLLRKYIMYAKRNCEPIIGDDATKILRDFYVDLRQKNLRSNGCNPVTMRQLESLSRLTKARAKVELRTECSKQDALDVIEIMKASMIDYYENDLSLLDMTESMSQGGRKSSSSYVKQFVSILQRISDEKKSDLFSFEEIKALYEKSNVQIKSIKSASELIHLLNSQSFLLKKANKMYKLNATNF